MAFRALTNEEINQLENQGCMALDWHHLRVSDEFSADSIHNVRFSGDIKIGRLSAEHQFQGKRVKSGLYNSCFHNCTFADDVYIDHLHDAANIDFETAARIVRVNSLVVSAETAFGNGSEIEAMNEGGGRSILMFDRLSAQIAYLLVFYRHDQHLVDKLNHMIKNYVRNKRSDRGTVGQNSLVKDCNQLVNVKIGSYAEINGAQLLENGTLCGCKEDPVKIGSGVIAKNFIIQSGSHVQESALLSDCFIGQGVRIGRQFSAEHALFFANCEAMHGEACSLFAGPYTATHHKSSLLIAGLFSFYNAGSGTNQSNHLYKLGALHQGVLERGAKTGSSSYLLWPTRVGAFSVVLGKHYSNFDASDFPFSYINEEKGKSVITPAMNVFTVGTRRDSQKWPGRDRRKDPQKYDLIHFDLFTPYVGERILRGMQALQTLKERGSKQDYLNHKGIFINRLMLKICNKYYDMAFKVLIGELLLRHIERLLEKDDPATLNQHLLSAAALESDQWRDIGGMLTTRSTLDQLIADIKKRDLNISELFENLLQCYEKYEQSAIAWTVKTIQKLNDLASDQLPRSVLLRVLEDWKKNALKLNKMTLQDAMKEFDSHTKIGYGIDGEEPEKEQDFKAVRGTFEDNAFVQSIKENNRQIQTLFSSISERLQKTSEQ